MEAASARFICPITCTLMEDPVVLGRTGHVFERSAITEWLSAHDTNPVTNERVTDRTLCPDLDLLQEISAFVASVAGREIPSAELTIGRRLGRGADKEVFQATWRAAGASREVAVLRTQLPSMGMSEAELFVRLGFHPHLVRYFGRARIDDSQAANALVTELAPLGDLASYLRDVASTEDPARALSVLHLLTIAEQVLDALQYIHVNRVIHRDVSARNVLVFALDPHDPSKTLVKLTDYGLSLLTDGYQEYLRTHGSSKVPFRWMPPEAIKRRLWSEASDVWAFGVLVWELFSTGEFPFGTLTDREVAQEVSERGLGGTRR